jgi:hypothetical protein
MAHGRRFLAVEGAGAGAGKNEAKRKPAKTMSRSCGENSTPPTPLHNRWAAEIISDKPCVCRKIQIQVMLPLDGFSKSASGRTGHEPAATSERNPQVQKNRERRNQGGYVRLERGCSCSFWRCSGRSSRLFDCGRSIALGGRNGPDH